MKRLLVLACVVATLGLGACKGDSAKSSTGGKKDAETKTASFTVVATTSIMAEFARTVGGEDVEVYGLLKPNVDAHDYEATPADVEAIADADIVIKSGLGLESWFDRTLKNADSDAFVVDASEGVVPRVNGETDPHYWQNPLYAKVAVHNISLAFQRFDKKHADFYEQTGNDYSLRLDTLDTEVRESLNVIKNRKVVTDHDAFGYYLDHFGMQLVGSVIPTFDSQAETSAQAMSKLITAIRQAKVKAIFTESSLPAKTAEAVGKETGVKVVSGSDSLYGDALGPKGSDAATYLDMIRHNTKVFVANLV